MDKNIELYGEEECEETPPISIKGAKEREEIFDLVELYGEEECEEIPHISMREEIFDLEKYPTMEMKVKKTRYKIVLD